MLNLLTILALEHRYIALIVSACIIVVSVTAIIIKYHMRTKVDENNVNTVYPVKPKPQNNLEEAENNNSLEDNKPE